MDISCNDDEPYRQDFNPDNELAIVVNPKVPTHLLAGSNDYFYRFNNSTGVRQALVPTGFFTSFDGGASWVDGQVPMRSGNGAGDPSPAFNGRLSGNTPQTGWAMMAQLENVGGLSGPFVSQGDVSVSYSPDGGITWSEPVTVMKGNGACIGPANQAMFFDKEWLTVDNFPASPLLRPLLRGCGAVPQRPPRRLRRVVGVLRVLRRRWAHLVAAEGDLGIERAVHRAEHRAHGRVRRGQLPDPRGGPQRRPRRALRERQRRAPRGRPPASTSRPCSL